MADTRKHSAGKGDKVRPIQISIEEFVDRYDYIKWPSKTKKDIDKKKNPSST